jgi:hypothetical protein
MENRKIKERKKEREKIKREGYYGHFTISSILHSQKKLFCQTFLQNGFRFTRRIRFTNTATAETATATATAVPNTPLLILNFHMTVCRSGEEVRGIVVESQ